MHHDTGMGGRWFRIMGEARCGLLTHEPDSNFVCGAEDVRWLSDWTDPSGSLPHDYHAPGSWPTPSEGIVQRFVCNIGGGTGGGCEGPLPIAAVNCGQFLLWRLAEPTHAKRYCTASTE